MLSMQYIQSRVYRAEYNSHNIQYRQDSYIIYIIRSSYEYEYLVINIIREWIFECDYIIPKAFIS